MTRRTAVRLIPIIVSAVLILFYAPLSSVAGQNAAPKTQADHVEQTVPKVVAGSSREQSSSQQSASESRESEGSNSSGASSKTENKLRNLDRFLDIIGCGAAVLGTSLGGLNILLGLILYFLPDRRKLSGFFVCLGVVLIAAGLATVNIIRWQVMPDRGASLFE